METTGMITTDGNITTSTEIFTSTEPSTTTINITLVTEDPGKGSLILNETITHLNVTTVEYIPIIAAASAFAVLLLIGIISVTIFTIILVRGRKRFQEFPFFAIVYHLTFTNALHICMQIATVLPILLIENDEGSANREWYKIGSYLIMITEQASLYFTFLMTINRFAVFVCPPMLKIFTTKRIHIMSIFIWIYINFIVWWNCNYGTIKTFSRKTLSMHEVLLGSNILTTFFTLCSTFLPIIMLLMYILILSFIIKKRKTIVDNRNNDRDKSFMVQALIITIALEMVSITDTLSPLFAKVPKSLQWVWTIFCYCVTIINQLINPFLFLTLNKMVRSVARHVFDKNITKFLNENSSSNRMSDVRQSKTRFCLAAFIFRNVPKQPPKSPVTVL